MTDTIVLNNMNFMELTHDEMIWVEGGNWLRTACGIVGGVIGGVAAFCGGAAAVSPVLTPVGGIIVGVLCAPAGAAAGTVAGLEVYDFVAGLF
jgi:ammonia channel protein AmtB